MNSPVSCHEEVLRFWFGTGDNAVVTAKRHADLWWNKSPELDSEIRERFGALRERAVRREFDSWLGTGRGCLALIILVDQMSRHIFRNQAEAFKYDHLAREWCLAGLESGVDEELQPIERVFFYVPLEHSESREDQARSVALYRRLKDHAPATEQELFAILLLFELSAQRHRAVVERFGRFPHRNRLLGRPSSREEAEFLKQPGSSF